eukprot:Tbor_TRINITY_DN3499_c0_g1::TRINITY_DN3499_c0_g1_i1::g.3742::m.3742
MPRDMEKERQQELAAIWGTEVIQCAEGERRVPRRKRRNGGGSKLGVSTLGEDLTEEQLAEKVRESEENGIYVNNKDSKYDRDGDDEDVESLVDSDDEQRKIREARKRKKESEKMTKKRISEYKLHCFVEQGTTKNDVREVFVQYDPKVDIKASQKGNVTNRLLYCVITFRNKAMALHAVKTLDGTYQRDLLGVKSLKLNIMLTREQNKIVRRKMKKTFVANAEMKRGQVEREEQEFIENFIREHGGATSKI